MVSSGVDSLYKMSLQKKCGKVHPPSWGAEQQVLPKQLSLRSQRAERSSSPPLQGAPGHWPFPGEPFRPPATALSSLNLCKSEAAPLGQPLF